MPSDNDNPIRRWLQKNPKTAQQIKHSFTSSSFRWFLWSGVTTVVHNLYQTKYNEGRCQAWCGAEVLPDHTLAQPLHLPEAGKSWYEQDQALLGLLCTLACSYVHLPSEQLSARLIPEDVRVGCVEERSTGETRKEEKGAGGSVGGKEGKGQKRGSGGSSGGAGGGQGRKLEDEFGSSSSRVGVKDGRGEMASSSSSKSGGKGGEVGKGISQSESMAKLLERVSTSYGSNRHDNAKGNSKGQRDGDQAEEGKVSPSMLVQMMNLLEDTFGAAVLGVEGQGQAVGVGDSSSSSTMWEIASDIAAASTAHATMLRADEAAAKERGEEPEKPLPFRFTWPSKPAEDAYAHWAVVNLPVGGEGVFLAPDCPSAALGGRPTALHVYLVLELLLLSWPDPHVPDVVSMSLAENEMPEERHLAKLLRDWLLLLMALLQPMSTKQKQQVLRERGPLLMQLLYQALMEDQGFEVSERRHNSSALVTMGGEMAWESWFLAMTLNGLEGGSREASERRSRIVEGMPWKANVPLVVTMVLQNLLFQSIPGTWVGPETARIGRVVLSPFGKWDTWARESGYLVWVTYALSCGIMSRRCYNQSISQSITHSINKVINQSLKNAKPAMTKAQHTQAMNRMLLNMKPHNRRWGII
jgi:hypothetical protein